MSAWAFLIAFTVLCAPRSDAATVNIALDPSGGGDTFTTITGSLANPEILDFVLTLNAIYGTPASSVGGSIFVTVSGSGGDLNPFPANFASAAHVFEKDIGNDGNLNNVTHFLVNVSAGNLSLLVDVFALLFPNDAKASLNPVLAVDLPDGLSVVSGTPLPGALVLFASGLGLLGLMRSRRHRLDVAAPAQAAAMVKSR
jgi:hypothetical protein